MNLSWGGNIAKIAFDIEIKKECLWMKKKEKSSNKRNERKMNDVFIPLSGLWSANLLTFFSLALVFHLFCDIIHGQWMNGCCEMLELWTTAHLESLRTLRECEIRRQSHSTEFSFFSAWHLPSRTDLSTLTFASLSDEAIFFIKVTIIFVSCGSSRLRRHHLHLLKSFMRFLCPCCNFTAKSSLLSSRERKWRNYFSRLNQYPTKMSCGNRRKLCVETITIKQTI